MAVAAGRRRCEVGAGNPPRGVGARLGLRSLPLSRPYLPPCRCPFAAPLSPASPSPPSGVAVLRCNSRPPGAAGSASAPFRARERPVYSALPGRHLRAVGPGARAAGPGAAPPDGLVPAASSVSGLVRGGGAACPENRISELRCLPRWRGPFGHGAIRVVPRSRLSFAAPPVLEELCVPEGEVSGRRVVSRRHLGRL